MHISKILIENFKCIRKLEIYPNENFNVIIGENSQGKTTVFEALQLWHRCYHLYIQQNRRQFYAGNNLYMAYKDLNFLRLNDDLDLFREAPNECQIGLTLCKDGDEFELVFRINRPQRISNAYYRILKSRNPPFQDFARRMQHHGIRLDNAIFLYQTSPVASVLAQEPFMNKGQVDKKMMRGKSQEVLRNKIMKHQNIVVLNEQVSHVLNKTIEFQVANRSRRETDEHIDLRINGTGRGRELYMQGSGVVQVTEIFATINYLAAELNILLIDEPDSHIHAALQKRLIGKIKELTDNQTFIISHNDIFVSEVQNGELFYLNSDAKSIGELRPLGDFDLIKRDFGNPIIALEKLNHSSKVVFVEGTDDKENIELFLKKYEEANLIPTGSSPSICQYFQIRGKDNLVTKIDNNKRTLSQLFRDKSYMVITDKDFTKVTDNNQLNINLVGRLGAGSKAISHDGYCLESTLFSDLNVLYDYLAFKSTRPVADIRTFSENYFDGLLSDLRDIGSAEYQQLEVKFESQKRNRPEMSGTLYNQMLLDATANRDTLKYIMNKWHIRKYVKALEAHLGIEIVPVTTDDSDEFISGKLVNDYTNMIPIHGLVFQAHKDLLNSVYDLTIV
ncbi:MAG: AAA family ATPase [Flavobacteriales bacterium]|nr:AAA family ATPase [Flavobacteriales bacterium]